MTPSIPTLYHRVRETLCKLRRLRMSCYLFFDRTEEELWAEQERRTPETEIYVPYADLAVVVRHGYAVDNFKQLQHEARAAVAPLMRERWQSHWKQMQALASELQQEEDLALLTQHVETPDLYYPCPPALGAKAVVARNPLTGRPMKPNAPGEELARKDDVLFYYQAWKQGKSSAMDHQLQPTGLDPALAEIILVMHIVAGEAIEQDQLPASKYPLVDAYLQSLYDDSDPYSIEIPCQNLDTGADMTRTIATIPVEGTGLAIHHSLTNENDWHITHLATRRAIPVDFESAAEAITYIGKITRFVDFTAVCPRLRASVSTEWNTYQEPLLATLSQGTIASVRRLCFFTRPSAQERQVQA